MEIRRGKSDFCGSVIIAASKQAKVTLNLAIYHNRRNHHHRMMHGKHFDV